MKDRKRKPKSRDPYASALADPLFRQRKVRSGSEYRRSRMKKEAREQIEEERNRS